MIFADVCEPFHLFHSRSNVSLLCCFPAIRKPPSRVSKIPQKARFRTKRRRPRYRIVELLWRRRRIEQCVDVRKRT